MRLLCVLLRHRLPCHVSHPRRPLPPIGSLSIFCYCPYCCTPIVIHPGRTLQMLDLCACFKQLRLGPLCWVLIECVRLAPEPLALPPLASGALDPPPRGLALPCLPTVPMHKLLIAPMRPPDQGHTLLPNWSCPSKPCSGPCRATHCTTLLGDPTQAAAPVRKLLPTSRRPPHKLPPD